MAMAPIRIAVVEHLRLIRDVLVTQLASHVAFQVVGAAADPEESIALCQSTGPQVVLMDVKLPGAGTFAAAAEIAGNAPETRIVLLSDEVSDLCITQALRLQVAGYLLKSESFERLCETIMQVAEGHTVYSPDIASRIDVDPVRRKPVLRIESDLASLTGRQLEVLRYLASGQSVKEIARMMHLSEKSVDSHKYRIMTKLGIHDRVELARLAIREGLLLP